MDKADWLRLVAHREVANVWRLFIWRRHGKKPTELSYSDDGSRDFRSAQSSIQASRGMARGGWSGKEKTRVEEVKFAIQSSAKAIYGVDRPRTVFNIIVGKEVRGHKSGSKGYMTLYLGYMWSRTVLPLYDRGFKNSDWMILQATRVKVNAKHLHLYECRAYNPRIDENKTVYIAETTIGEHRFTLGHSIRMALDGVENIIAKEVQKQLTGEDQ